MALPNERGLVARIKAALVARGLPLAGPCGGFAITKRVAWELRMNGAGLLSKSTGNNCDGFAVDIIVFRDGSYVDMLVDGGGANEPAWNIKPDLVDSSRWRAPFDPGDAREDDPRPTPPTDLPAPRPDPNDEFARVIDEASVRIVEALMTVTDGLTMLNGRVEELQRDGLRWRLR